MKASLVAVSLIATLACAPMTSITPLTPTPYEARPANYPITLFTVALPRCAFDEIATVRSAPPLMGQQPTDAVLLDLLRVQARKAGGDAVVRVRNEDAKDEKDIVGEGTHFARRYTGTIIRYRDSTCKE
jgi:hypothetical protein